MALRLLVVAVVALLVPSCMAKNVLYTNEILNSGQSLNEGTYRFTMQFDCNLVLYDNERVVWASGTNGHGSSCYLKMQSDGNLVIYGGGGGNSIWASNTSRGQANFVLVLQSDRNVVIYGPAIWATNTYTGTLGVVITGQKNGTLVDQEEAVDAAAGVVVNRKIAMVTAKN